MACSRTYIFFWRGSGIGPGPELRAEGPKPLKNIGYAFVQLSIQPEWWRLGISGHGTPLWVFAALNVSIKFWIYITQCEWLNIQQLKMIFSQCVNFHENFRPTQTPSLLIKSYQSITLSNFITSNPKREQVEDKLTRRDFCTPWECYFLSFLDAVSKKVSGRLCLERKTKKGWQKSVKEI